jgi:hypothetical protein
MFLNSEDMSDDEDAGNNDIVVPLSLVASTPQIINGASRPGIGNRSALEADDPPGGRSNQYNERLARARALNEQKRKVSTSGARRKSWVRRGLGGRRLRCGRRRGSWDCAWGGWVGASALRQTCKTQAWSWRTSTTFNGLARALWHLSTCCLRRLRRWSWRRPKATKPSITSRCVQRQPRPAQPHLAAVPSLRRAVRVCSLRWCKSSA